MVELMELMVELMELCFCMFLVFCLVFSHALLSTILRFMRFSLLFLPHTHLTDTLFGLATASLALSG